MRRAPARRRADGGHGQSPVEHEAAAGWTRTPGATAVNRSARTSEADGQAHGQQQRRTPAAAARSGRARRSGRGRSRRAAPCRTGASGQRQRGEREQRQRARPPPSPPRPRTAPSTHTVYSTRVRWSPSTRRASACPSTSSVGMSRRLLMTSSAQASRPTGTRRGHASQGSALIWTIRGARPPRPAPKNTNTDSSPSAAVPVRLAAAGVEPGRGDRRGAEQEQPPGGHRGQHEAGQRRRPRSSRARRTAPAGACASPEPTSRTGPTRRSSVPRIPSL